MKYIKFLFTPVFMGALFIAFAVAMAVATFIENDFGSAAAYSRIYGTRWFELILLLLIVNLIGQLVIFKMFRKTRLPAAIFHLAFILMITGAAITRYRGWEGSIHIREGETSDICYSADKYIGYTVKNENGELINEYSGKYSINSFSTNNFKREIKADDKKYQLVLAKIIPNSVETISDDPDGFPVISMLVIGDKMTKEIVTLEAGESKNVQGIRIGFDTDVKNDVIITLDSSTFFIKSSHKLGRTSMMTQETDTILPGERIALKPMQIIAVKNLRIVPQQMSTSGIIKVVSLDISEQQTGKNTLIFHIFSEDQSESFNLWTSETEPVSFGGCLIDGLNFEVSYGSQLTQLPFSLRLDDFILERYPGSNSPSGYKSNVTLIDKSENLEKKVSIFMNNILKYKGFRLYQSSYDRDEKGTILSVNHDRAGMRVTYTGYSLLFLFIVLSLLSKSSLFNKILARSWYSPLRKGIAVLFFFMISSGLGTVNAQRFIPGKDASDKFGKVLVQDQKGRTKPLFTLSSDIIRKVTRKNKFEGYTSMQVFLGLYLDFEHWKDNPLIKVTNRDLQQNLGINSRFASFSDLVDLSGGGTYRLSESVNAAYAKSPGDRSKFDKEIMKVDERVNIVYMIYRGDFMRIFPLKDGTHNWGSSIEARKTAVSREDSVYLENIIPALTEALRLNNTNKVIQVAESVSDYQSRFANYPLPAQSRISAEVLYYKLGIFERLFPFYATAGLIMIITLIIMVIRGIKGTSVPVRILSWLLFAGFILHTSGLGLRWYISGHSPMSNGYESMLFISWITLMAGFIFRRRSVFALSATAVLSGMTLLVAHMSFMDPEITNLVPVLKSYWLTLHVSVITGSYGFLGLGAILGLLTIILIFLSTPENKERISNTVDELTVINYKTLTLGLYFLTIGTFLGAVWANESWGRYWGWDPKETWSLITIIVYALVIHSRLIPGMNDIYVFNLLSLFAFSSVLMTYFGVNYYLSGLHSYASGDPVPVPVYVYVTVLGLIAISIGAYIKYNRFKIIEKN